MSQVIMIGCDLHDRNMSLRYAVGTSEPQQLAYDSDAAGRRRMIARLKLKLLLDRFEMYRKVAKSKANWKRHWQSFPKEPPCAQLRSFPASGCWSR